MNKLQKILNKAIRSRKRVSPQRLKELRDRSERKWLHRSDVIGVGQSDKGVVVYKDKTKPDQDMDTFDLYTESPLEIIYTEPFSMLNWGEGEKAEYQPPPGLILFDAPEEHIQESEYNFSVVPTKRIRPIYGGLSIGHKDVTAGTLSMIVQDKDTKELLILSNNHVLANLNKGKKGDKIVQPGIADGGKVSTDTVGYLERFVTLKDGATADCAVAKLVSPDLARYGILGCGDVWFPTDPVVGMALEGFGRTTGFQIGAVKTINNAIKVGSGDESFTIKEVFVTDMKSSGGDSGRALNERYTAKCAGLLFAGNSSLTLGVTSKNVFDQLNIELMSCPYELALDLSHYNGRITAQSVAEWKAKGVKFVILKCSDGDQASGTKDSEFDNSVAVCEAGGMPWAPYHFARFNKTAQAQYNWFMKCLGDKTPSLQPMVDCELTGGENADKITSVAMKLLELIDAHFAPLGYKPPFVYTRGSWSNTYFLRSSKWAKYPLHAARWYVDQVKYYDSDPYFPYDWEDAILWQCKADKDYLAEYFGVPCKHVDVNYILDKAYIESCLIHVPPGEPEEPEPPPEEPEEPEEPEPPVEDPELKTAIHYFGKVLPAKGLTVRNAPKTSGTKITAISKGTEVEILETVLDSSGNTWARIGFKEYSAMIYNGETLMEFVKA